MHNVDFIRNMFIYVPLGSCILGYVLMKMGNYIYLGTSGKDHYE